MKKVLFSIGAASLIFTAACSEEKAENTEPEQEAISQTDVKSALMDFQMKLTNTINKQDAALYSFDALVAKEEEPPTQEEVDEAKKHATETSVKIAESVKDLKIPSDLKPFNEELTEVVTELSTAYKEWGTLGEENDHPKYTEHFENAQASLTEIYEQVELEPADLATEVK
ncbi:hypothetical protein [Guptibacillus spartinae]|uniref:hypothetical protein n=1 Tax=Guptibacillus spartinae TaxID=3025679 RepID=UPI00236095C6|nr:hypothetical protein [Pseudalkalibacillus spartinae]